MQYIKLTNDKWVEVDEDNNTSRVVVKSELENQIAVSTTRLAEIPPDPTDQELLDWAKINFPRMDYSTERRNLQNIISTNSVLLENLK